MTRSTAAYVEATGPSKIHALRVGGDPFTPCGMWAPHGENRTFDPDDPMACAICARAVRLPERTGPKEQAET